MAYTEVMVLESQNTRRRFNIYLPRHKLKMKRAYLHTNLFGHSVFLGNDLSRPLIGLLLKKACGEKNDMSGWLERFNGLR